MYGRSLNDIPDTMELCKVGDSFYRIVKPKKGDFSIRQITITELFHYPHCVYRDDANNTYFNRNIQTSLFKTKEEAMQEMKKRKLITKKKELLKEYEVKLNEEFGITNHFIIK